MYKLFFQWPKNAQTRQPVKQKPATESSVTVRSHPELYLHVTARPGKLQVACMVKRRELILLCCIMKCYVSDGTLYTTLNLATISRKLIAIRESS